MDKFSFDISLNGLQAGDERAEVKKIAFSVDATLDTIEKAAASGADMLFVHHGLFWGAPVAITGNHYRRVKALIENNLSLYACHLPLDAHLGMGNNFQMGLALGIRDFDPFCYYKGEYIGVKGKLPFAMSAKEISALLGFAPSTGLRIIDGEKRKIESVAIVSGSSSSDVVTASNAGVDAYITGEFKHEYVSYAREKGITVIAGGHYQSETFGVKAVMRMVERELALETVFIDSPSGF
jgi:dinuclear metal center protein, YbgI/SA1388 family